MDWQTYAALAVVAATLGIFIFRMIHPKKRKKNKAGCDKGCCG